MAKHTIINNETGEIISESFELSTQEDKQKATNGMELRKSKDELKVYIDEKFGSFYFLFYKALLDKGIEPKQVFRMIYLTTFSDYHGALRFGSLKDNKMTLRDLQEVLILKKSEYHITKKYLIDNELIIVKDGVLYINNKYFFKGKLKGSMITRSKSRVFDETIRNIYRSSKASEHKKLALFVTMLPYVNYEYNILCHNPTCTIIEDIKPIKLEELSIILGYSSSRRMKSGLFGTKINNTKLIGIFSAGDGYKIIINPMLYYKGRKIEYLDYICKLFGM